MNMFTSVKRPLPVPDPLGNGQWIYMTSGPSFLSSGSQPALAPSFYLLRCVDRLREQRFAEQEIQNSLNQSHLPPSPTRFFL